MAVPAQVQDSSPFAFINWPLHGFVSSCILEHKLKKTILIYKHDKDDYRSRHRAMIAQAIDLTFQHEVQCELEKVCLLVLEVFFMVQNYLPQVRTGRSGPGGVYFSPGEVPHAGLPSGPH